MGIRTHGQARQPPLGSADGNGRAVTHRQSRKLGRTAVLEAAPGLASEPFLPLLPRSEARCPQCADGWWGGARPAHPAHRREVPGTQRGAQGICFLPRSIDQGLGHRPCAGSRASCRRGRTNPLLRKLGAGREGQGAHKRQGWAQGCRAARTRRRKTPVSESWGQW